MYLELKISVSAWGDDFLNGYEQRRRLITAFEGKVPDGRLIGREADHSLRQGLVRPSGDHPVAMAYGSAPPITFRPTKGGIHLVAFGSEASDVLEGYSPTIKKLVAAQFGRLGKTTLESGRLLARESQDLSPYECGSMVVKKLDRPGKHQIGQTYNLSEVVLETRRSVAGGIVARCVAMGGDDPTLGSVVPHGLESQVSVLGGVVLVGRPGGEGGPLCLIVKRLRFALPLTLRGYWEGGHYRSFGYGAFVRSRPPALSDNLTRRAA